MPARTMIASGSSNRCSWTTSATGAGSRSAPIRKSASPERNADEQMLVRAFDDRRRCARDTRCVNSSSARRHEIAARERHGADDGASRFAAAQRMHFGARLRDLREARAVRVAPGFSASRVGVMPKLVFSNSGTPSSALELARRAMNARLRHVLRARGEAEVAVLDDGAERLQLRGAHESSRIESSDGCAARQSPQRRRADGLWSARCGARTDLAGRGQRDAGVAAGEQRRAEVALHAGDRLRHARAARCVRPARRH